MDDIQQMLKRQAVWQRSRQSLTWPEKIRMAEMVRESVKQLRASPSLERNRQTPRERNLEGDSLRRSAEGIQPRFSRHRGNLHRLRRDRQVV